METETLSVRNPRTVTFEHVLRCAQQVLDTYLADLDTYLADNASFDLPDGMMDPGDMGMMDPDDLADRIAELVMVGTINWSVQSTGG